MIATLLLLPLMLSSVACDNSQFKERIADFQESVGLVSGAVGTYYAEMNQFERELYLQDVLLHPTKIVSARGTPPTLFGPFNEDSIKARMDAITLLGKYGQRLALLAGTDAPERFASASQELGTNLFNLQSTFRSLDRSGDPTASNFLTPIGTIVGVIGKMILEAKRDKKLRLAIDEAAPAVRTVIDLIENDLNNVIVPARLTGHIKTLQDLVEYYNCLDRTGTSSTPASSVCPTPPVKASLTERRDLLSRINQSARQYELFKTANPGEAVSSMREAHEALVKYAADRNPKNLAALVSTLDAFRSRAQQIANAVLQIRNLNRGVS
jgi:hypothetical protein